MAKKSQKRLQGTLTDPTVIDESGLIRYDTEMPLTDPEGEAHWSVRAVEGYESGLKPKSMRTSAEEFRLMLASNLLIDWMLETYAAQNEIKSRSDDNSMPGIL